MVRRSGSFARVHREALGRPTSREAASRQQRRWSELGGDGRSASRRPRGESPRQGDAIPDGAPRSAFEGAGPPGREAARPGRASSRANAVKRERPVERVPAQAGECPDDRDRGAGRNGTIAPITKMKRAARIVDRELTIDTNGPRWTAIWTHEAFSRSGHTKYSKGMVSTRSTFRATHASCRRGNGPHVAMSPCRPDWDRLD
jgi:hypothetical protein